MMDNFKNVITMFCEKLGNYPLTYKDKIYVNFMTFFEFLEKFPT